ncbi:DUF6603 domain-containing protein [Emticicia sp. 17c]|uniref:DUF6603 domain-containing protein n=1 Tax=Emticicia sp. 17c TaxID=3127704 RepID=UPI00301C63B0
MDINELKKIVEDGLKGTDFSLNLETLSSPEVTSIAKNNLPASKLTLSGAKILGSDADSITISGTGTDGPFKGMAAEARFYILTQQAALTLKASGDSSYTLVDSFPQLQGSMAKEIVFNNSPQPPSLYLLSDPDENHIAGLSFTGEIDFKKISSGISTLLNIQTQTITGPVVLQNGAADFVSFDLTGPQITGVKLYVANNVSIDFKVGSFNLPNPFSESSSALPYIELSTAIPFSASNNQYSIPVAVKIINLKTFIRFSADITSLIEASLNALSSLVNGVSLEGVLPPKSQFPIENILKFNDLYFDFDATGLSVKTVGLQVKSTSPWTIFTVSSTGKTFRAENMVLDFFVLTPFSGAEPYLNLKGEITLTDKASLAIMASYPNFEVQGFLKEDSELSIREFVEQFVGQAAGIPEELFVEQLSFDFKSDDYSFELEVDGVWNINDEQNLALMIHQLGFAVNYTSSVQTASFYGILFVGEVEVTMTADYEGSQDKKGWIFTGKTGQGQRIPIDVVTNYLEETFGAGKIPDWVKGTTLQDLYIMLNTLDKSFDFSITGNIPLAANNELKIIVGFAMNVDETGGYKKVLSGKLFVGKSVFSLVSEISSSDTNIAAKWVAESPEGYLQFADIAHAFGFNEVPAIPSGLDLALKEATIFYDFTTDAQSLVIAAASANYGSAVFVAKKIEGEWTYVFGIDIKINIGLGDLPLVGSNLESVAGKMALDDFKLIGATKPIKEENVKEFNKLIKEKAGSGYLQLPEMPEGIQKGLYCALVLELGADNRFEVPISTASKKAPENTLMLAADTSSKDDNAYWIQLQKTIGPVYFDRAGVSYKDGRVSLLLDASLIFTALKIELISLGVSNPLSKLDPAFELSGLNIAYQSGPVQIAAGFLKQVVDGVTEYTGTAVIGVKTFNLSALGSYASVDGHPSLFIFALLSAPPLGGPPAFFITGVAAGFGYNRGLKLPTIDTVSKFPLTMGFVPNQQSPFKSSDPGAALGVLIKDKVVPVEIGQNWLAAGIKFTSFQLVESFALLSFAFGTNLEIGIIGMSTVSVPPKSPTVVAYAQLALLVKLLPDKGEFSVEAKLTPASYLLSSACVLTGGFAFYLWTAPNEHEGDFVITLGGYHPNFKPPLWYPKVPRLGFNWIITSQVTMKGGMYFALTPTCIMAGGSLEAMFSTGNLKAWFTMGVDFLIAWKPYHYEAHLYVSFGVSYTFRLNLLFTSVTKTISVSIGADLAIWGPEFSGTASIHLWIISFNISFGASGNKKSTSISWKEFKDSFLPPSDKTSQHEELYGIAGTIPTDTYCLSKVTAGLMEDLTKDKTNDDDLSWIVSRNGTILETYSIIPSKEYEIIITDRNGAIPAENLVIINQAELDARNKDFGVGMVEVANADFNSKHTLKIEFAGILAPNIKYDITAIIRNVPKSLWEKREVGYTEDALVKNVLVGFRITPRAPIPAQSVPISLENFKYRFKDYAYPVIPAKPEQVAGPDNVNGMEVLMKTIDNEPAKTVRKNIIDSLRKRGMQVNPEVNVAQIAAKAEDYIMAPPVLSYTYWKKSA